MAGLTKALRRRGHDVRIVMPLYGSIDRARFGLTFSRSCCVHFGQGEEIWVGIFEGKLDGEVPIWLIDYDRYFGGSGFYGAPEDAYRFGVLSKAALQLCKDTGFIPHVAHVHDWMSSMAAVFLKTWDRTLSPLSRTASVLTIHTIGYQGKFDARSSASTGWAANTCGRTGWRISARSNLLKAGIQYADAITTVSPTYAQEIKGPVGGMGLAPYLNNRRSISSASSTASTRPSGIRRPTSTCPRPTRAGTWPERRPASGRSRNGSALAIDPAVPIFAVVSRFAPQKGFDLLRGALPQALRDMAIQVVALGTGDPLTENFFRWLGDAHRGRANAHIGFSPELAHLIEAGSDFFLMPSLYEPCGLNQMYRRSTARRRWCGATGGLEDTVENYDEATGRGDRLQVREISDRRSTTRSAGRSSTWYDRPHHYQALQQQGMARDFSWEARRAGTRKSTRTRKPAAPRSSPLGRLSPGFYHRGPPPGQGAEAGPRMMDEKLAPSGGPRRTCSSRTS